MQRLEDEAALVGAPDRPFRAEADADILLVVEILERRRKGRIGSLELPFGKLPRIADQGVA